MRIKTESGSRFTFVTYIIEKKPPWYWRMIGRRYWSGWMIKVVGMDRMTDRIMSEVSPPEPDPPTPEDVAAATQETIEVILERLIRESLMELPDKDKPWEGK